MTFGFLRHHFGHKQDREEIKNIIIVDDDIEQAKTKLNNLISEHDTYKQTFNDDETIHIDNSSLHHAQAHLLEYERTNSQVQKDRIIRALDE